MSAVQPIHMQAGDAKFIPPNFDGIPSALTQQPFAMWIAEPELDPDGNQKLKPNGRPKFKKAPKNDAGYNISKNKPEDWLTCDRAVSAFETGRFTGIGVLMQAESGLVGIDLDDVSDMLRVDAAFKSIILKTIKAGIYCEQSPSGTGLRMFVYGKLPNNAGKRKGGIELYSDVAFLTITGHHAWKGEIKEAQWLVDELLELISTGNSEITHQPPVTEITYGEVDTELTQELEEWARYRYPQLWEGRWKERKNIVLDKVYPSPSEADFALTNHLARETVKRGCTDLSVVAGTVWEVFQRSGLYRPEKESQIKKYAIPKAVRSALQTAQTIATTQSGAAPIQFADIYGDVLNGKMFARLWKDKFIYVATTGKWLHWVEN